MSTGQLTREQQRKVSINTEPFKRPLEFLKIFLSISGYVPQHATVARTVVMLFAVALTLYIPTLSNLQPSIALIFFALSTILYMTFIYTVLPEGGYKKYFIQKYRNEEEGFRAFEATLAFLFFLNGSSIGVVAQAFPADIHISERIADLIRSIGVMCIIIGFSIKVWAAKVVSIDIYYWKDMFLGRKITDFVVEGPYKFVRNPMYGLGHLQAYGIAIWYMSYVGFLAAVLNQLLVFSFYFFVEKKFIKKVYLANSY